MADLRANITTQFSKIPTIEAIIEAMKPLVDMATLLQATLAGIEALKDSMVQRPSLAPADASTVATTPTPTPMVIEQPQIEQQVAASTPRVTPPLPNPLPKQLTPPAIAVTTTSTHQPR